MQRIESAVNLCDCFTVSGLLIDDINITKMLSFAIAGKGEIILRIYFDQTMLDEIDLLWKVIFEIDDILFIDFYLSQLLHQSPYKIMVLTFSKQE